MSYWSAIDQQEPGAGDNKFSALQTSMEDSLNLVRNGGSGVWLVTLSLCASGLSNKNASHKARRVGVGWSVGSGKGRAILNREIPYKHIHSRIELRWKPQGCNL